MNISKLHNNGLSGDPIETSPTEPILYEYPRYGKTGVDFDEQEEALLASASESSFSIGEKSRKNIGLPEVSEPQVLRHFVRLSQLNFNIASHFYPLGSCTMKHNPRLNEKLARLPGFAALHPLQEEEETQGALEVIYTVGEWLKALSGLDGVTLNPAAGAHGEFAGLMVIRRAHEQAGNPRKIVLIPDSAHGTNPATATMCGYETLTIPTAKDGSGCLDLEAYQAALKTHGSNIAGMMLTNPNTCGKFERDILEITRLMHEIGGYVYCDGANFNALVGRVRPGDCGIDVMHFNLHKTFSTPHGGGGPGSGPIATTKALTPFLPLPWVIKQADGRFHLQSEDPSNQSFGRLRAFQGQFGMAVRALAYMLSHGRDGLKQVAEDAVLNANYIQHKLAPYYHVAFPGNCMHETLLSDKDTKTYGVTTLDIAKTLIEYGIHPMTVYFPLVVPGAMLIEPTETEGKETLDRFIEVMIWISEQAKTEQGAARLASYPENTPVSRPDEVKAARTPQLVYQENADAVA